MLTHQVNVKIDQEWVTYRSKWAAETASLTRWRQTSVEHACATYVASALWWYKLVDIFRTINSRCNQYAVYTEDANTSPNKMNYISWSRQVLAVKDSDIREASAKTTFLERELYLQPQRAWDALFGNALYEHRAKRMKSRMNKAGRDLRFKGFASTKTYIRSLTLNIGGA